MDTLTLIGIFLIVGAGCWLLGAAGGHYAGYRKGYADGTRHTRGLWILRFNAMYGKNDPDQTARIVQEYVDTDTLKEN